MTLPSASPPGFLALIGIGPGNLNQMTPAAIAALQAADVVIGYQIYLDLVAPLFTAKQEIMTSPLGGEVERARQAITLAAQGQRVALISSGDIGIYAMASPVFEILRDWPESPPEVEVFPGISAVQAAAARLGAPLGHDFCTISLSDLLTPWSIIERRVEAAAWGDFVVAFYNPRSQKRDWQLQRAIEILLGHRSSQTPAALVRNVTRPDETIHCTTLGQLDPDQVDMFTLVIIGNSQSYVFGEWLVTPRGYEGMRRGDEEARNFRPFAHSPIRNSQISQECDSPTWHDSGNKNFTPPQPSPNRGGSESLPPREGGLRGVFSQGRAATGADHYPLTLTHMAQKQAVVIGGGPVGERKVRGLLNSNATVTLISPEATPQLRLWAETERIVWQARLYQPGDLAGTVLVFAATNQRAVNAAIAQEARQAGLLCNVADQPGEGNFHVPAVHRQTGVMVAVSTAGKSPGLARRIRDEIASTMNNEQ